MFIASIFIIDRVFHERQTDSFKFALNLKNLKKLKRDLHLANLALLGMITIVEIALVFHLRMNISVLKKNLPNALLL